VYARRDLRETHLECSEVDETVNLGMLLEHLIKTRLVCDVDIVVVWLLPADEFNALESFFGRVVEVVNNHDFVAGFEEGEGGERANVASATVAKLVPQYAGERKTNPVIKQCPTAMSGTSTS
jgi:hypothetical protein